MFRLGGGKGKGSSILGGAFLPCLYPEMVEDTVRIVNETIKDKIQVNLVIKNRAGGNAPPDRPEDRRPTPLGKAGEFFLNSSLSTNTKD